MNPTARWSRDDILKAVRDGRVVVTRNSEGRYRDLSLSAALKILRDGQTYTVNIAPHEILIYLP